jgi:TonB family protein
MTTPLVIAVLLIQFVRETPNIPVMTAPTLRYSLQPNLADCHLTPPYKLAAIVSITVNTEGNAQNVHIAHTSGNPCVDKQAVAAGTHFRFSPALKESRPVPTTITLTMNVGRDR